MKVDAHNTLDRVAKTLAPQLSLLLVNSMTEDFARMLETYWCILLGKGAGSGTWALDAEIKATKSVVNTSRPIIFDVGANRGEWALLLNRSLPEAQLFLFEPQPVCQRIINSKKIPNSVLIPNAVSSAKHSVKLCTSRDSAEIASLHQRRDSYFRDQDFVWIDVDTTTLDDVISDHNLQRVDFVKMDIEGHELEALKGAAKSLEGRVIRALSFEFGSGNINSRTFFHDFWDFLYPLGYQIYRVLPSGRLMHIGQYYEDCEYFRGVTNYFAVLP